MREKDRRVARKKLDIEMKPYRWASREKNPTNELLRAVRLALGIPIKEIVEKMGIGRSSVCELERRELRRAITLESLGRMAAAMGCRVVYGVVPLNGKTLEQLAEERLWKEVLGRQGRFAGQAEMQEQESKRLTGEQISEVHG